MNEKHLAFYRLRDACGEAECPICAPTRRRMHQYFEGLLYERINDPQFRQRFRRAGGFCNPHSYQFLRYHDALGGSILYQDLVAAWLDSPGSFPTPPAAGLLPGCPACAETRNTEQRYLELLGRYLEDEELKEALLRSQGLCFPHLRRLRRQLEGEGRRLPAWLGELQGRLAQTMVRELKTYVEARNYSLGEKRPELSREQELAWTRVLRQVAGFPWAGEG